MAIAEHSAMLPIILLLLLISVTLTAELVLASTGSTGCSISSVSSGASPLYTQLDGWWSDSVRMRISPTPIIQTPSPQALTPSAPIVTPAVSCHSINQPNALMLSYGNINVTVSQEDGSFTVTRVSDNTQLIQGMTVAFVPYAWQSTYYKPVYPQLYTVTVAYLQPIGFTHALGEHHHGREQLHYSNYSINFTFSQTAPLKGDFTIPWKTHSVGMGVLLNHAGWGSFSIDDTAQKVTWIAQAAPQLDLWFTTTPKSRSAAETVYPSLINNFLHATDSFPAPLPHYASGFWQCKLRYRSQDEALAVAAEYHRRNISLSMIVLDYQSWAQLGDYSFNPVCFPDPHQMMDTLHSYGTELMLSMWPHAGALSKNWDTMVKNGYLTHNSSGQLLNFTIPWVDWPPGPQPTASAIDWVNPDTQQYMAGLIANNYFKYGVKGFWLDADEPDCAIPGEMYWNSRSDVEILSAYPLSVIKTIHQAFIDNNITDGIMLSRDTWVGGSKMGAAVWSGDIMSSFPELYRQILVSQNVALSGVYHWTTDVGGFIDGTVGDPVFEELIVRWYQFGAFCPIFRTHGDRLPAAPSNACGWSGGANEVWSYQHYDLLVDTIQLRETFRPYIEETLQNATVTGAPLLRPMFYNFVDDDCFKAEDQFMFGDTWLVAPVWQQGATNRTVYLPYLSQIPDELAWLQYFTKQVYSGGQWLVVPTKLSDFPLFQIVKLCAAEAPCSTAAAVGE